MPEIPATKMVHKEGSFLYSGQRQSRTWALNQGEYLYPRVVTELHFHSHSR